MPEFAQQLNSVRREKNITQEQLAIEMNVSRQTISHWENGRAIPDVETIKLLSKVLEYNFLTDDVVAVGNVDENTETLKTITFSRSRFIALAAVTAVIILALVLAVIYLGIMISRDKDISPAPQEAKGYHYYVPYSYDWYQSEQYPVEGQPFINIYSAEDPLYLIPSDNPNDPGWWNYNVIAEPENSYAFTAEKMLIHSFLEGEIIYIEEYGKDVILNAYGTDAITENNYYPWMGGFGLQPVDGLGFTLCGTDENGNELQFHCYIELIPELRE